MIIHGQDLFLFKISIQNIFKSLISRSELHIVEIGVNYIQSECVKFSFNSEISLKIDKFIIMIDMKISQLRKHFSVSDLDSL